MGYTLCVLGKHLELAESLPLHESLQVVGRWAWQSFLAPLLV